MEEEFKKRETVKRDTMKFLSSIGFDLIPQNFTDLLIDLINLNPTKYGFETKIDLEN
jgi:predicted Zn-dependent protease with MMP-like domain